MDGQVHVLELLALGVACFFAFAIGYSLPIFGGLLIIFWPLLLLQLLAQGLFEGIVQAVHTLWRKKWPATPKPPDVPSPPRHGFARLIWWAPLLAVTLGYAKYVLETGRWFL